MHSRRPANLELRLTWDLAADAHGRHAPGLVPAAARADLVCRECARVWPCPPRQAADDTMRLLEHADTRAVADYLPGADYAHRARALHVAAAR